MQTIPHINQWTDYGFGGVGAENEPYDNMDPEDFRLYGLPEYGAYAEMLGIISGDELPIPMAAEVDQALYGQGVYARTPMIELAPDDYRYVSVMKQPYSGMMGLGDDGTVYEWDGTLGFFRKLFRKAKKAVKRVARKVRSGVRKVLKKIPGGKYVLKLGKKIFKIASKIVKPLTKFVGRYAAKLAPVAALIPGYGPAIAGALYAAGKVANLMNKYGVKIKGAAGKVRKLAFKSGKSAKAFRRAIKSAARKEKSKMRRVGKRRYSAAVKSKFRSRGARRISGRRIRRR